MKLAHVARRRIALLAFSVLCSEWVNSSCLSLLSLLCGWCRGGSVRNLPLIHLELQAKKKAKYHNSRIFSLNQWSQLDLCACVYVCLFMHVCTHDWCPCMPLPLRATLIDCLWTKSREAVRSTWWCQLTLQWAITQPLHLLWAQCGCYGVYDLILRFSWLSYSHSAALTDVLRLKCEAYFQSLHCMTPNNVSLSSCNGCPLYMCHLCSTPFTCAVWSTAHTCRRTSKCMPSGWWAWCWPRMTLTSGTPVLGLVQTSSLQPDVTLLAITLLCFEWKWEWSRSHWAVDTGSTELPDLWWHWSLLLPHVG